ncbi:MAG: hypothetical protein HOV81_34825 [Kofleriaceae bacterium]|nr:hypothetical protein [Kofleriaceae bacterium]
MVFHSYELVEELDRSGADLSAVRTILRFMEANPSIDFGTPGPLVQFVERFLGYEAALFESLSRQPMDYTVWMLNRLINGTEDPGERARLMTRLEQISMHPAADADTKERAAEYLEFQRKGGVTGV